MALTVKACRCGAVTILIDEHEGIRNFDVSMTRDTFDHLYGSILIVPDSNVVPLYYHCNHCVNHWGIDICGCGSGEPTGQCGNDLSTCRASVSHQDELDPAVIRRLMAYESAQ